MRRLAFLVLLMVALTNLWGAIFSKRGFIEWRRAEAQRLFLQQQIKDTQQNLIALKRDIDSLNGSALMQERIIRQTLGYVRPDEMVIDLN